MLSKFAIWPEFAKIKCSRKLPDLQYINNEFKQMDGSAIINDKLIFYCPFVLAYFTTKLLYAVVNEFRQNEMYEWVVCFLCLQHK
jgi:hypothetical protein